jgi:hypothetical protein
MKTNKKFGIIAASIIIAVILAFAAFKEQTNVHAFTLAKQITFGGSNEDVARGIDMYGTKKVIVGYTNSFGAGGYDVFIAVNGTTLDMWTIGTSNDDFAYAVKVVGDFAYIVGCTRSPTNYYDVLVFKWNLLTNSLAASQFIASGINIPRSDCAYAVDADASYVFVTGVWRDNRAFLAILNATTLTIVNFAELDFSFSNDVGYAIDVFLVGGIYNIIIGGGGSLIFYGGYDAFIANIIWDPVLNSFTLDWVLVLGTAADDWITSLLTFALVPGIFIYVAGHSNGNGFIAVVTIDGGIIAGKATDFGTFSIITSLTAEGPALFAAGYFNNPPNKHDAFILHLDTDLNLIDAKGYGKGGHDRAFGIAADGNNIHVVGGTSTYPNTVYNATSMFSFKWIQWDPGFIPTYFPYMFKNFAFPTFTWPLTPPTYSPAVSVSNVSPTFNSPTGSDAFYVRFTYP